MSDRWRRLAPLTGVIFSVLLVVAIFSEGETPESNATSAKVIAYFASHRSSVETSTIVFAFAFLFLVLFAGSLRSYLRRTPAAEGLSALVLAGGVLAAAGGLMISGVEHGLAEELNYLGPETAQTLNFLSEELFLPIVVGAFLFAIASGLAVLRGARLPKWLGWAAIVIGIVVLIPPLSFPALLAFAIWTVIVSILVYVRTGGAGSGAPEPSPAGAG